MAPSPSRRADGGKSSIFVGFAMFSGSLCAPSFNQSTKVCQCLLCLLNNFPPVCGTVPIAIGTVPHTGGKLFSKHSKHWHTLVDWLKDGAHKDPENIAKPTKIELFPPSALLEGEGATQQLSVLAHYSDGTTRDVTPLTVFQSSNDVSAAVDEKGLVTAGPQ